MRKEDRFNWFVLDAMEEMQYHAMTLGELELYRGVEYVERIVAESDIPIALANARYTGSGELIGQRTVIHEVRGLRYGIIGLIGQDFGEGIEKFEELGFTIEDPFKVAADLVPAVSAEVDLVVVLAHMGSADTFQLPKQVPGIDLLVFGHYPGTVASTQVEGAVTIRSGQRGQYFGETRVVLNPENEIVSYKGKAIPLTLDRFCEDPRMAADLAQLKSETQAEAKKQELERELAQNEDKLVLGQDHYLGDLKCARCHVDVYESWQETGHAEAWQSLVAEHKESDTECLECHVTGFRAPGGFRGVGTDQDMRNVQCEACHGMGTLHDMAGLESPPLGEQTCLPCHDAENSPGFDFESYWAQIAH